MLLGAGFDPGAPTTRFPMSTHVHPSRPSPKKPHAQESPARRRRLELRDPERVSLAYTPDTEWRNRAEFLNGREEVVEFLRRKWAKEHDYRLKKTLWAFTEIRIAVRFEYELARRRRPMVAQPWE